MRTPPVEEEAIFNAARRLDTPEARRQYLQELCGDNAPLRARVEALLRVHDEERSFLQSPVEALRDTLGQTYPAPGTVVGPYWLREQIGEGGFGIVYRAEQTEPVRRTVAVKILKPGMDSRPVLARFRAELQALALMDHPNIARVLDAGTLESEEPGPHSPGGRPYFVMELVDGVPVTTYCDEHRLTPRQRLELFVPICQAVQHAHQKGIIHRDLKPSNVLVALSDGRPVPKVIDFGVAKATGPRLTEQTASTESGALVGTLEYMSPEQAELNPLDIDTRSDIYSLGVLLYELLTGTTPLDRKSLREASLLELLRRIREEEPPRPSTQLRKDEGGRMKEEREKTPSPDSSFILPPSSFRELDWIVMKCLEKDRSRRYETADGLARDLERYLADEPVEACPPSAGYRLRKFARKNRKLLATGAAFLAVLLLGGGVTGWQAVQLARAERAEAERAGAQTRERASRIQQVHVALNRARELRAEARVEAAPWDKWAEAQAQARRAEALLGDRQSEPELAAEVDSLLCKLAGEENGRRQLARLEAVRRAQAEMHGTEHRFFREKALPEYRDVFLVYGMQSEVTTPEQAAESLRNRQPAVRSTLVGALEDWLDLARRARLSEAVWLEQVLALGDKDDWRQRLRAARRKPDRETLQQLAREVNVATQPPQALVLLSNALRQQGAIDEAVALLRRTQEAFPGDVWVNLALGWALQECRPPQLKEAVRFLTAAAALRPDSAGVHMNLGLALADQGRLGEAESAYRRALSLNRDLADAHNNLGLVLGKMGRPDEAATALRRAIELNPDLAEACSNLGVVLIQKRQFGEALTVLRRATELKPDDAPAQNNLGAVLRALGRGREAETAFREAIRLKHDFPEAHNNLGRLLGEMGRLDESLIAFRQATELKSNFADAHNNLAGILVGKGRFGEAIVACRRAVLCQPDLAVAHGNLGDILRAAGCWREAEAACREAIRLKPDYAEAYCNLGWVLRRQGKFAEALVVLKQGHEMGVRNRDWPYPSARWLAECQRLVALEDRLPAILAGSAQPADAAERNEYALLCHARKLHTASARLRAEALTADPKLADDLQAGHRHVGACAAALAGVGQGADAGPLGDRERAQWRKQAVQWLQADLELCAKRLEGGKRGDRELVRQWLRGWQSEPELAGLRESATLGVLPAEERQEWQRFWAAVEALLTRTDAAESANQRDG